MPNSADKMSSTNQSKTEPQHFKDEQELKAEPVQCDETYLDVSVNSQSESLRTINHSKTAINQPEHGVSHFEDTSEAEEETEVDDHVIPGINIHQPPRISYGGSSCACSACTYTDTYAESQTYPCISDISQTTIGMGRDYRLSCTSSMYDNIESEEEYNETNLESVALAEEQRNSDIKPAPWKLIGGSAKFQKCNSCCDGTYSVTYYRDSQISISTEGSRDSQEYLEHEENASMLQSEVIREDKEHALLLKKKAYNPKIGKEESGTLKTKTIPDDFVSSLAAKSSKNELQRKKDTNLDISNMNRSHGICENKPYAYQDIKGHDSLCTTATPKEPVDDHETELNSEDINDKTDELPMLITSQVKDSFSSPVESSPDIFPCREQFVHPETNYPVDCQVDNIEKNETTRYESDSISENQSSNTKVFKSFKQIVIRSPASNVSTPSGDEASSYSRPMARDLPDLPKQDKRRAPKQEKVRRLGEMFEQNKMLSTRHRGRPYKGKSPRYFGSGLYKGSDKDGRLRDISMKRIGKVKSLRQKFEKTAVVDKTSTERRIDEKDLVSL